MKICSRCGKREVINGDYCEKCKVEVERIDKIIKESEDKDKQNNEKEENN